MFGAKPRSRDTDMNRKMLWALWGSYIATDSCGLCPVYFICRPRSLTFSVYERCRRLLYQLQRGEFETNGSTPVICSWPLCGGLEGLICENSLLLLVDFFHLSIGVLPLFHVSYKLFCAIPLEYFIFRKCMTRPWGRCVVSSDVLKSRRELDKWYRPTLGWG